MAFQSVVVGNISKDIELKTTQNGKQYANFTVINNTRVKNKQTGNYEDSEADTTFVNCKVWDDLAAHVAQSLGKGMRVVVVGSMRSHSYQGSDGNTHRSLDMNVEEIGVSLRFATVQVQKAQKQQGFQPNQYQQSYGVPNYQQQWAPQPNTVQQTPQPQPQQQPQQPAGDPWAGGGYDSGPDSF
ncbi:single-stranded DNA-binding protein [Bifidobacterium olomucense]|uniref:Single-stranded DNA-binding protein n=1 Tax=Bifidobacterium olomucense TaxID=2675324 RepID=A0A7Y0EZ91_9BIFI|nr:single-stranded DNA-binding protein [Bifidobacterium sp. DSM 109959]NMM98096.1 single-stranded DNA-binding protein [Bifidobacterium sp. DSM 109959]